VKLAVRFSTEFPEAREASFVTCGLAIRNWREAPGSSVDGNNASSSSSI